MNAREYMEEMLADYAFIDTETGGLHEDRIPWEVAVVRWNNRTKMWGTWVFQITDWENYDQRGMEPIAAEINGYYERFGKDDLAINTNAEAAARLLNNVLNGATLVGSAVYNDDRWLKNLVRAVGLDHTWSHRQRDVPAVLSAHLGNMEAGGLPWALEQIQQREWCGDRTGVRYAAHTALGDTLACRDIWLEVYGLGHLATWEVPRA